MKVELISITKPEIDGVNSAEDLIAYCARVSNPGNQMNSVTAPALLNYLIQNKHWSPFEMVSMCISIETSRAIAAQILRHRSFSFQEFSQRYSKALNIEPFEIRLAGSTNRQSSTEITKDWDLEVWEQMQESWNLYDKMVEAGVATESARMVLPLSTTTKLYMNGTLRSWIHYLELRCDEHTQKEHRIIANEVKKIIEERFNTVYQAIYGV